MLVSETDKLNNIQKMLELGLIEEWEKFMLIDPNLTEEEAKEKLARIKQAQVDQAAAMAEAVGMGEDEPSDAQEPEENNGNNQG